MRRYDEPIEVRRGLVTGQEAPEQFIWRDRLWVVSDVVSHWVETGAWWDQAGIAALLGVGTESAGATSGTTAGGVTALPLGADLLAESDLWRVEAMNGLQRRWTVHSGEAAWTGSTSHPPIKPPVPDGDVVPGYGVFDLAFDWVGARWRLVCCAD